MSDGRREPDGGSTAFTDRDTSAGFLASVPLDIVALLAALVVSVPVVIEAVPVPTPVRVLVGLPFVAFLPGYALTTALFPKRGRTDTGEEITALGGDTIPRRIRALSRRGLTGVERAGLGLGVSILLAPLIGLFLDVTLGYDPAVVIGVYGVLTAVAAVVALVRHRNLAPQDATGNTVARALGAYRRSLGRSGSDTALVVLVTACVLFAGVAGAFALAAPQDGTSFSEFVLLTQNDDGEYVAGDYPTSFTTGESRTMYVGIENMEDTTTTYSVVVQLDRVRQNDGELTVLSREQVGSFSTEVAPGETGYAPTQLTLNSIGEDLRLTYLLYQGDPPENPTTENAYRHTYLWVDVTGGDGESDDGS